jgi:hypothetical protein
MQIFQDIRRRLRPAYRVYRHDRCVDDRRVSHFSALPKAPHLLPEEATLTHPLPSVSRANARFTVLAAILNSCSNGNRLRSQRR